MDEETPVRPGWLPPRPPRIGGPVESPPPPAFVVRRPRPEAPSSPLAVTGIALSAVAILLLLFSLGTGWVMSAPLGLVALGLGLQARRRIRDGVPGRPGQAKAAIVLAAIALGLAAVAALVWALLHASGITYEDALRWLEDLERRRGTTPNEAEPA